MTDEIKVHEVQLLPSAELFELEHNSQKQSKHEFEELRNSIRDNGFDETLLVRPVDGKYEVVSGNHRYRAGVAEGMLKFPCVVQEDWDDTKAMVESVRRNYVRGKIDKDVFTAQVNQIVEEDNLDLDTIREQLGFEDEETFADFYLDRVVEEDEAVKAAAEAVSTPAVKLLDDLGTVLSNILAEYGHTVPNSFIIFPAGKKHHIYIAANSSLKSAIEAIAEKSVEQDLDINVSLGGILQIGLAQTDFLTNDDNTSTVEHGTRDYEEGTDVRPIPVTNQYPDETS